jgi:hypothetical protein
MVLVGLGTGIESYLPCFASSDILCLRIDDTPHDIDIITQKVYVARADRRPNQTIQIYLIAWQVEHKSISRRKFGRTVEV